MAFAVSSSDLQGQLWSATQGLFDPARELPREAEVLGRVSVICPTTDERALFHAQLYSCFDAQTWSDKELVVIDTGCQPSAFLRGKALEDPRLVYRHFRMMGTSWSVGLKRNLAVHLSSGSVIAHFDDDDLYAPCYLKRMLAAMAGSDAVTLSSWFVCDACTGLVAHVKPQNDGSQDSWILGYGFSHVYRRKCCIANPFPHQHFGEDYKFLVAVRDSAGCLGVRTLLDEEGLVLHMQQGLNLSNSHANREVGMEQVNAMPVAELPGFMPSILATGGHTCKKQESSFISMGEAYRMYMRPSPHRSAADMRCLLRLSGVATPLSQAGLSSSQAPPLLRSALQGLDPDAGVLASCLVTRRGEFFVEPGRVFAAAKRFPDEALLPGDVPRNTPPEQLALLHLGRLLLSRCPARAAAAAECEGWIRLQLRSLSHVAVLSLLRCLAQHFPRVRLEVDFQEEESAEHREGLAASAAQRQLLLQMMAQRGTETPPD